MVLQDFGVNLVINQYRRIMKTILVIFISTFLIGHALAAYLITCPSEGKTAINKTGQETIYINGVATNYTFTVNDYDSQLNANDCYVNQVPDNQVFSGNALTN